MVIELTSDHRHVGKLGACILIYKLKHPTIGSTATGNSSCGHYQSRLTRRVSQGVRTINGMNDESDYREEWRRLGYQEGMGSASFLPPPVADFVRAYYMTSSEFAVNDIGLRRLKVARFSEVNDPFELLGLNCYDPKMRKLTKSFRESQNNKTGLLSFSANWTNPVLWSHYATRHKGICLGFDLRRSIVQFVEYADQRLRGRLVKSRDNRIVIPEDIQDRLCRTKSDDWRYEQEIRVFVELEKAKTEGGLYFWPFNSDMRLAEVILGPRCDNKLSTISALVAVTSPDAVVFKARLAFKSFRVVLDGRTRPTIPAKTA